MKNLTPAEAAAIGGAFGSIIAIVGVFAILFCILMIIATWKIFKKAGEPGWKSIIPIYNVYVMFKIVNMKSWFWWLLGLSLISCIVAIANNTTYLYNMTGIEAQTINFETIPVAVLIISFIEIAVYIWAGIVYCYRLSKAFGHGLGYTFGLIFLPNIFQLIIAFGSSKYDKKALKK